MKHSYDFMNKDNLIEKIQELFDSKFIDKTARLTKFVQRTSKLKGFNFFMLCVFDAKNESTTSIEDLTRELQKDNIFIRKQSLQDRFNSYSSCFMKKMIEHALSKKLLLEKEKIKCQFNRIIINDSTSFQLPESYHNNYKGCGGSSSIAGLKMHYCYNLLSQEIIDINVGHGAVPDSLYPLQDLQRNDLRIEDLGYFKINKFKQIKEVGAYFLSRFRFHINVSVVDNGIIKPLDLLKVIRRMSYGEIKSINVQIGEKEKFATRLVIEKLPKKVADEKRRKLKHYKKQKQRTFTKELLIFCDVNTFVTNCNQEQLPTHLIRQCYSLRWQVEIIFKSWKTHFKIDKVRQMKIERFECFHYGCLMLIILSTHLLRYCRHLNYKKFELEISELKFFKLIVSMKQLIKASIRKSRNKLTEFLDNILAIAEKTCIKEQRLNRLQPLKIIRFLN